MQDVAGLQSPSEVLTIKQTEVLFDWKDTKFGMEMINGRKRVTSSDETETSILDKLETVDGSG